MEILLLNKLSMQKRFIPLGTIYLLLINDIFDLAKIESGKMDVHLSEIVLNDIVEFVENYFRPCGRYKRI